MDRRRLPLGLQPGLGFEPEFNGLEGSSSSSQPPETGNNGNPGNFSTTGPYLRRSTRKSISRGGANTSGSGIIDNSFDSNLSFVENGIYLSDLEMPTVSSQVRRRSQPHLNRGQLLELGEAGADLGSGQPASDAVRGRVSGSGPNSGSNQYIDTSGLSIENIKSPDNPVTSQPLWSISYSPMNTVDDNSGSSFINQVSNGSGTNGATSNRISSIVGSGSIRNNSGGNLRQNSGSSVGNTPGGHETDSSTDEPFFSFAGESQQQRRSLLLQQQLGYDAQPQQLRLPNSNSVLNYEPSRGRSRTANPSAQQQQQQSSFQQQQQLQRQQQQQQQQEQQQQQQQQQKQQQQQQQQIQQQIQQHQQQQHQQQHQQLQQHQQQLPQQLQLQQSFQHSLQSHQPPLHHPQSQSQFLQNQRLFQQSQLHRLQQPHQIISVPARSSSVDSRTNRRSHNIISGHVHQRPIARQASSQIELPHYAPYDKDMSSSDDQQLQQPDDPVAIRRRKYKAKSSIPPDLSSSNYAEQCAAAAVSSRLNPYRLHVDEYNILRSHLSYIHVTTYLNIRNGILRLWLSNPIVKVTMFEAAGCTRDERFYGLAEFAYEWLVRNGYINFGCLEYPLNNIEHPSDFEHHLKPRPTIVIIGAGISGLGCARQLDSLLHRYAQNFTGEYEDIPRIIVLEGRRRIGGRIYSAPLRSDHNCMVDLGAQVIMGYGDGNPLGVLVRRQLGLPIVPMEPPGGLYDSVRNEFVGEETEDRAHRLYQHLLKKMAQFKNVMPQPSTVQGDEVLMNAAKDPSTRDEFQESQTIAKLEENGELPKPYEDPGFIDDSSGKFGTDELETQEEFRFLKSIGIDSKKLSSRRTIHVAPEPPGEMYPSLGETLGGLLSQINDLAQLTPEDIRLVNWYLANLEYSTGTNLDNLSLSSWNQDEGHDFSGRHSVIRNGYMSLTRGLYVYPEKLDVRFKTSVKVIEYHDDYSDVFLENGDRIQADRVIVTVPLGVLKDRTIQFIPDLPQWKTDSIERLGFGVMNKVSCELTWRGRSGNRTLTKFVGMFSF